MKLIVGLGNPGPRYRGTYHNVGFEVVDEVARRYGVTFQSSPADALVARLRGAGQDALLAKPLTFMNLSGPAVGALQRYFRVPLEDLLVVLDEVNLELGRLRVRGSGSAGGHNGLKSIIETLGTGGFPRLRVGVGRGDPQRDLSSHVLARVDPDERAWVQGAIVRAADAVERFIGGSLEDVMREFNPRQDAGSEAEAES
jgi:peptidyl-tRNA hydrolase, PTH1 family